MANALGKTTPTEAGICPYQNTAALENELEVFKCCELLPLGVATIALFLALITSCFSSAFGLSLPSLLENGWTDNSYVWVMKINARGHPVPLPPLMVFFLLSFPTKPKTHHNSTCFYLFSSTWPKNAMTDFSAFGLKFLIYYNILLCLVFAPDCEYLSLVMPPATQVSLISSPYEDCLTEPCLIQFSFFPHLWKNT